MAIPYRVSKQISELDKKIGGNDIIISRNRNTGYEYKYNGHNYNIDVDFMWQNYLSTTDENSEKIIIGSNHTLYAMYMINMIERLKGNDNNIFIALPHVKELENIDFKNLNEKPRKIVMGMSASRMKNPDSTWEKRAYDYIEKLPSKEKENFEKLFYEKTDKIENEEMLQYLNRIITRDMNFQNVVHKFKEDLK